MRFISAWAKALTDSGEVVVVVVVVAAAGHKPMAARCKARGTSGNACKARCRCWLNSSSERGWWGVMGWWGRAGMGNRAA